MKTRLTVRGLRKALKGLKGDLPVFVEAEAIADGEVDTLHAVVTSASFEKPGPGGFFSPPPVARFAIYADGVPEGTCRDCGEGDGKHARFCDERESAS